MSKRLTFRPVGIPGGAYPEWLRALDGKSGVYVIRQPRAFGSAEVVYVGESHTGRLYGTITRHFQGWRRYKSWWSHVFAPVRPHDPGLTYPRATVEVAVRVTSSNGALDLQAELIQQLRPRDNLLEVVQDEQPAVPF